MLRLIPRRRLLVDPDIQGSLMFRVVAYWCFCVIAIAEVLLCWDIAHSPEGPFFSHFRFDRIWEQHGSVLVVAVLVLPIMVLDVLAISNRFVGPLYRVRRALRSVAAGEAITPVHFRKNDFRPELADELNAVLAYIEDLRRQLDAARVSPSSQIHDDHLAELAAH